MFVMIESLTWETCIFMVVIIKHCNKSKMRMHTTTKNKVYSFICLINTLFCVSVKYYGKHFSYFTLVMASPCDRLIVQHDWNETLRYLYLQRLLLLLSSFSLICFRYYFIPLIYFTPNDFNVLFSLVWTMTNFINSRGQLYSASMLRYKKEQTIKKLSDIHKITTKIVQFSLFLLFL